MSKSKVPPFRKLKCICGHSTLFHRLLKADWSDEEPDGHCFHFKGGEGFCTCKKYTPQERK